MKDATGRDLEPGQIVAVPVESPILNAYVLEVSEGGLVDANGQVEKGRLIVSVSLPITVLPGHPARVYIVGEAKKKEPKIEEERVH